MSQLDAIGRELTFAELTEILRHHEGERVQVALGDIVDAILLPAAVFRGEMHEVEPEFFQQLPSSMGSGAIAFYIVSNQTQGDYPVFILTPALTVTAVEALDVRGVCVLQGRTAVAIQPINEEAADGA